MSEITIQPDGGRLCLSSPYHPDLPAKARALGGRFDPATRRWSFDPRDEARVRDLAREVYGTDGQPGDTVTVRLDLAKSSLGTGRQTIYLAGRQIAHRPGRDAAVRLGEGVIIVDGGFRSRGGSMKYPALAWEDGTVLEVRDLPAGHADLAGRGVTLIDQTIDRAALAAERERLTARISEIDQLLGAQDG
jgi:hypothetical protein